jgi:hypothetical protein
VADSAQHVLARWYDEGVDAFRASPADGRELLRRYGEPLARLAASASARSSIVGTSLPRNLR